jgi:hypothetical protein
LDDGVLRYSVVDWDQERAGVIVKEAEKMADQSREDAGEKSPLTRRQFLQAGSAAAAVGGIGLSGSDKTEHASSGSTYEAEIPDTLDLAERGAFAVNALTGTACPEHGFETYHGGHFDHRPPYLSLRTNGPCMQKPVHALPMMRVMSGSTLDQDYDLKMMEAITRDIDEKGLWWLKVEGRPWRAMYKEDFVNVSASGRFMVALGDWYRYDHNSDWLRILERMAHGLPGIAVEQGGHTMFLDNYGRSGAKRRGNPQIYTNGLALRGFTRWYAVSGDKAALNIVAALARYMQNPPLEARGPHAKPEKIGGEMVPSSMTGTWKPDEDPTMVASAEHAHWQGHFHSHTMGMIGLAEYANQVNDAQAKRFVADFYEYARNFGIARIGFFPAVVLPLSQLYVGQVSGFVKGMPDEGCAIADMTLLAILLSDGGVGDYWDDVDQYVRNHLIEHQILRRDLLEETVAAGPQHKLDRRMETDDRVIERQLGAFISIADPTQSYAWWTMCCLGNCSVALYKAWESIVRYDGGVAQVNLLLNRASAALDVDSYLPYEGKVVLKNRTAQKAYVRMPAWVDKSAVRCRINERPLAPHWLNRYLIVEGLAPQDVVAIEFPVADTTEEHLEPAFEIQYACRFRGNTLLDITPRATRPVRTHDMSDDGSVFDVNKGYPLYLREPYKGTSAPTKKVQRFISPAII